MWQLDYDGTLAPAADNGAVDVDGACAPDVLPDAREIVVHFSGYADGRGFSTGRRLRALGFKGRLVAKGPLAPDQARHAFQSGFDSVLIEDSALQRHGAPAWQNALERSTRALYITDPTSRGGEASLWHARQSAQR